MADRARRAAYSGRTSRRSPPAARGRPPRRLPPPRDRDARRAHRRGSRRAGCRAARRVASTATTRSALLILATTASGFPSGGAAEARCEAAPPRPASRGRMRRSVRSRGRQRLRIRVLRPRSPFGKASLMRIPLQREDTRAPAAVLFQRQPPGHAADAGGKAADPPRPGPARGGSAAPPRSPRPGSQAAGESR